MEKRYQNIKKRRFPCIYERSEKMVMIKFPLIHCLLFLLYACAYSGASKSIPLSKVKSRGMSGNSAVGARNSKASRCLACDVMFKFSHSLIFHMIALRSFLKFSSSYFVLNPCGDVLLQCRHAQASCVIVRVMSSHRVPK